MRLPNADRAFVDIQKLREYCLNPAHPRGKHKARVFASVLGITAREAAWLRTAFLQAAGALEAKVGEADAYGRRYHLDVSINGPKGTAAVRTTWIVRAGEDFARLTSCYVL